MSHPCTPDEPPREAVSGPPTAAPGGFTGSSPTAPSGPTAPTAPSGPSGPSGQPTAAGPDQEYYVAPGPPPASVSGTYPRLEAPLPRPPAESSGAKRRIIPVAGLLALAMIAAAVYFLFLQDDDPAGDRAGSSTSAERSAAPGSEGSAANPAPAPEITGSYEVTGTIASYTGPQTGQLGGSAKKPGDPAFKAPQTWTIAGGCTGSDDCELTITPGDDTVALTLDGDTWTGQTQTPIQCTAAGPQSNATVVIEIDAGGATATRTVTAGCEQQAVEIDDLVLTAK